MKRNRLNNVVDETKIERYYSNSEAKRAQTKLEAQIMQLIVQQQELFDEKSRIQLARTETKELIAQINAYVEEKCGFKPEVSYDILRIKERLSERCNEFEKQFSYQIPKSIKKVKSRDKSKEELSKKDKELLEQQNLLLDQQNGLARAWIEVDRMYCFEQAKVLEKEACVVESEKVVNATNFLIAKQAARENPSPFNNEIDYYEEVNL